MRRLALSLLAIVALGCGGEAGTTITLPPTRTDVAGTYFLRTANGVDVPFMAFTSPTEQWQLVRDQFVIENDNTWTETTSYVVKNKLDESESDRQSVASGTYSIANGQINFIMTTGGSEVFRGSVTDAGLTLVYDNSIFTYVR